MEIKKCELCKGVVNDKDNFVRLTDYQEGKVYMEKFYHTVCFNNQIKGANPQQQAMFQLIGKLNTVLDKVGGETVVTV